MLVKYINLVNKLMNVQYLRNYLYKFIILRKGSNI